MNILFLTTSTNNTDTFIGSLQQLGGHDIAVFRYDRKFYEQLNQMAQANPGAREAIQRGQFQMPRDRAAMDAEMLMEAKVGRPDAIVYVSAWQGHFVPLNETLGELNSIAPVIHLLNDGQDPPWLDQLYEFDRRNQFSLTVNIDGGHKWPGGKDWIGEKRLQGKCMTLLTPIDLRTYQHTGMSFKERPFPIGYSGSPSSPVRTAILNRLNRIMGFNYRPRDEQGNPNSYREHIGFLQFTQASINVPFTGSGVERQVKGRVLEAGFAKCCCLEWQSDTMRSWFTPRYEFVEYGSVEECAEMAEWHSHHPEISQEIGEAMYARLEREHHPRVFWNTVLAAAGK